MMTDKEKELLGLIGSLIRGDWSGNHFDGRDVRDWIQRVVNNDRLDELEENLRYLMDVVYS